MTRLLALVVLSMLSAGSALAAPDTTLTREPLSLRSASGVALQAETGRLLVPENRARSASRRIPICYLRLRSTAAAPRTPLFFLAGGPGQRAVSRDPEGLDFWLPFLAVGDIVLIDQRGTADPALRYAWDGAPPKSYFVSADSAGQHEREMVRRAAAAFKARGVDMAGYTTVENARDLEALRVALELPRISLLAFSYGTHLAFAYLREFAAHVDNAVLIGNEGPGDNLKFPARMDTAFVHLARAAAADSGIGHEVGDLTALYDRVVTRLQQAPMTIPLPSPGGGDSLQVPVGPFGLRFILRADIGDASDLPVIPRLLWSIDHGDPSVLAWFLRKRAGAVLGVHGMNLAVDEASGASPERRAVFEVQARTSRFADVINFPAPWSDGLIGASDLGESFRAPLQCAVRSLFISGSLDFQTPPEQSAEIARGFRDATQLVVENAGHEQTFWQNPTATPVIVDFLRGVDVHERRITYPPLRFEPLQGPGLGLHPAAGH